MVTRDVPRVHPFHPLVAAEYFIRKICIFLRVIVIRRGAEATGYAGRLKQNQLFIRIGREKVLIIRGKYKLNTRREVYQPSSSSLLPLPLSLSFSFTEPSIG